MSHNHTDKKLPILKGVGSDKKGGGGSSQAKVGERVFQKERRNELSFQRNQVQLGMVGEEVSDRRGLGSGQSREAMDLRTRTCEALRVMLSILGLVEF